MKKYSITTEIFSIPYNDKYIIYAPIKQLILLVSPNVVNLIHEINKNNKAIFEHSDTKILKTFLELGLLNSKEDVKKSENNFYAPTFVTLFLTNKCNMRCLYCYASGGEHKETNLPFDVCKSAIDFIINNAILKKQKHFGIGFHGGGEPTLAWQSLRSCVEYARNQANKNKLKANFSIASNGVLNKEKIVWIIKNFSNISVSLDGPKQIQDYQRPRADGKGSFVQVFETIKTLNNFNFNYAIRSTITNYSLNYIDQIVNFFCENCKKKTIRIEPVFACGRAINSRIDTLDPEKFINGFRKAQKIAEKFGMNINYSGARLQTVTNIFCMAAGHSLCITPDGHVTSCYEVLSKDDPRSEIFFFGYWNKEKRNFIFNQEKLENLRKRVVTNIPQCQDCFCKYHCAGDCLAKAINDKDLFSISNSARCQINQTLTLDQIISKLP